MKCPKCGNSEFSLTGYIRVHDEISFDENGNPTLTLAPVEAVIGELPEYIEAICKKCGYKIKLSEEFNNEVISMAEITDRF